MNGLDFIFLLILGFTAIRGFARGLLKEFISLFGLLIGLLVASLFYEQAAAVLEAIMPAGPQTAVIAYILLFLLALGGTVLLGLGIQSLFESSMLSGLGRLGGIVLGTLKGGVVCSVLLLLLMQFLSPQSEFLSQSRLRPYVQGFSQSLASFIPEEFRREVREKGEEVKETWEDSVFDKLKEIE